MQNKMQKKVKSIFLILAFLVFNFCIYGQDIRLKLQHKELFLTENIRSIKTNDSVIQNSRFNDVYYVVLQFRRNPTIKEKEILQSLGVTLLDYIPNFAFTARLNSLKHLTRIKKYNIRSVFNLTTEYKTLPAVLNNEFPDYAVKIPGYVDLEIITYEKVSINQINDYLYKLNIEIIAEHPMFRSFSIRIPQSKVEELVGQPFIQWVEFIQPPHIEENLPGSTLHSVNILQDGLRNLKGNNINIGLWDGGIPGSHTDFSPSNRIVIGQTGNVLEHATHCAGSIIGKGNLDPFARGMAPNAQLFSYSYFDDVQTTMASVVSNNNLAVSSHPYGDRFLSPPSCNTNGVNIAYNSTSRNTDIILNNLPNHLQLQSAGNQQSVCPNGWFTITGSGKSAKNNIVVAAIDAEDNMTFFSSFGPVRDGRVKPDISAFGNNVYSTTPNNNYKSDRGTSMAVSIATGAIGLVVERYKQLNNNKEPSAALIKNTVLNTAIDLGSKGPDYKFGYGRIHVVEAVKILENNQYVSNKITNGNSHTYNISVPAGIAKVRIMLTWNDPAGTINANQALVNNLDITVRDQSEKTYLPWILNPLMPASPAVRNTDNMSNVEQIEIENPTGGNYEIKVTGTSIPSDVQEYFITWQIEQAGIVITYPNGKESFTPNRNEIITWSGSGLQENQKVEYSIDDGISWETIGTVSPGVTRLQWLTPFANTSRAKVRVSSGSYSDQSDENFNILNPVSDFIGIASECLNGLINFSWSAVSTATHYDIYQLDNTSGDFKQIASNISGTSYTAKEISPNEIFWYTIIAKNNITGAVSQRINAIRITANAPLTYPENIEVDCTSDIPVPNPKIIIANTNCNNIIQIIFLNDIIADQVCSNRYKIKRTYQISDNAGNFVDFIQTITVNDHTPPVFRCNDTISVCGEKNIPTPDISKLTDVIDNCSGSIKIEHISDVGIPNRNESYEIKRTYRATDLCGNFSECVQIINVNPIPVISNSPEQSIICSGSMLSITNLISSTASTIFNWTRTNTENVLGIADSGTGPISSILFNNTNIAQQSIFTFTPVANGCKGDAIESTIIIEAPLDVVCAENIEKLTDVMACSASVNYDIITNSTNPEISYTFSGATNGSGKGTGSGTSFNIGITNVNIQIKNICNTITCSFKVKINDSNTPLIVKHPQKQSVCSGEDAAFTIDAKNAINYSWQNWDGERWKGISNTNNPSYRIIKTNSFLNNKLYRAVITGVCGSTVQSDSAILVVRPLPEVTIKSNINPILIPGQYLSITATPNVINGKFIWYYNGSMIYDTNATLTGISVEFAGKYSVLFNDDNNCSSDTASIVVSAKEEKKVWIYPNPNNGKFVIQFFNQSNRNGIIRITDLTGRVIHTQKFNATIPYDPISIQVGQNITANAIYFVEIIDSNQQLIGKGTIFIIEK